MTGPAAFLVAAAVSAGAAAPSLAQEPASRDTLARVTVTVRHDGRPVAAAQVRALGLVPPRGASTDERGVATLALPPGARALVVGRVGLRPDTLRLALRAGQDTAVVAVLEEQEAELESVVVTATRSERRLEDTPLRVEVVDEEEIAEKVAMTPGDIAMMLNETSGLRVQTTSPSLGGATVRVQGLRGRYSLILADGLPLYGGQAGGLGLLQIPPVDLGRVEIVKGAASALYGSSALGGVIDLVSRRPGREAERTALVNATSRGGADAVFFGSGPLGGAPADTGDAGDVEDVAEPRGRGWGYTLLAGAHRQRRNDLDGDGWTDMPGYERAVARPRLHFDDGRGRTAFLTVGLTAEDRDGGTLPGRVAPDGAPHAEGLRTRRDDVGAVGRALVGGEGPLRGALLTLRASAMTQRHAHRFGALREDDRHATWFAEAAAAVPRGRVTTVLGAAFQREAYRASDVPGFDYTYHIPAAFAQVDADPAPWVSLSASARVDAHSDYGTFVNPRVSVLLRRAADGWSARASAGTGAFAPTWFTEETEATGLAPLVPPGAPGAPGLVAERARSASLDVGGPLATALGRLELNGTLFGSAVRHALQVVDAPGTALGGASRVALANAPEPTRTWGAELLARLVRELGDERALRLTATYTHLRATECDPDVAPSAGGACARRAVPLNPRHAAGLVASIEAEGRGRVGVEVYHTGRQALDDDPYRARSRPYTVVGVLAERVVETRAGAARLFVNLENLTDVRQTRVDPLVLPARGPGGRWTTDVWSLLEGRTINGGVRLEF